MGGVTRPARQIQPGERVVLGGRAHDVTSVTPALQTEWDGRQTRKTRITLADGTTYDADPAEQLDVLPQAGAR